MPRPNRRAKSRTLITAEDLCRLQVITSISLSPDEKAVAYTVERIDQKENKYFSNLWVKRLDEPAARQYTFGQHNDGKAFWSPDGTQLAFVSTRDKKTGIYLIPAAGGAERNVIVLDGSVGDLLWHPDGRRLIFALRYNDSHFIEDEKKKKEAPVFRHITRLFYRLDGAGFLPKDTFQIYALTIDGGALQKITSGKRDNLMPTLSPDGRSVAYVSNRSKDPDIEWLRDDLFVMPIAGGRERRIPTPPGPVEAPKFSPDGKRIAYLGHDNPDDAWGVTNTHLWVVGVSGEPKARDLMPKFDRMAVGNTITDLEDAHGEALVQWSADGRQIFFLSSDTGNTNLWSIPAKGGTPTRLFRGKCHIKQATFNGRTRTAALVHSDLNSPGELAVCPAQYRGETKMVTHSDLNPLLRKDRVIARTREVSIRSFDGTEIQGFLVTPPRMSRTRTYPAILEIHGGPRTQYGYTFFHEMQYLAAQGYVVLYTNIRGGSGKGETWAAAIEGGWGDLDYQDCLAAADFLEGLPYVDRKRIGVTGGSYGGYMTNWIVGHTHRFRAAVTQRSVVDLRSFYGSSDVGWSIGREFDGKPWTHRDHYDKHSPLTYAKNIRTPLLILHNEKDLRCNIEQAEQLFTQLKVLGKKVEFVRFPDEPHGLSRHGRPDRRLARLDWIRKWFDRYLKK